MHVAMNAFFWDRPDTGSGQYLIQLVRHLLQVEPSLAITLVFPAYGRPPADLLPDSCRWQPVPARSGHLGKVRFEQIAFPRACRQLGVDLAHVPYWGSPLRSPAPTVVTVHDLIPLLLREYRGGLLARFYTSLVAAAARGAQAVITDSFASKSDLVARLGLPAERVSAIHLAAGEQFQPGPPDPAVAAKYRLPEDYALYLGGFDVRKNVDTLLHAYSFVGPSIGVPLVLAGKLPAAPSSRFSNLGALIETLELEEHVHLTGFIDEADKPAVYRGAAVVVQIATYEGFGLTPLEAMACGVPVVASDSSSLPEVVGSAGFTLPPDDVEGIAGAIIACIIQEDLREDLIPKGLEQAGRFSWRRTAGQTLQVYRDVLAKAACA